MKHKKITEMEIEEINRTTSKSEKPPEGKR
jgi:hypothetical protein